MQQAEFLELLKTGADFQNRKCTSLQLYKVDLSGRDLSGIILSNSRFSEVNLSGAILKGARMPNIKLEKSNLSGANLEGADLRNSNLNHSSFCRANLKEAKLNGASFIHAVLHFVDFTRANLEKAKFAGTRIEEANFTEAILHNSDFFNARLSSANFSRSQIKGANFSCISLRDCLCFDLTFQGVNFHAVNFDGAKFLDPDWLKNLDTKTHRHENNQNVDEILFLQMHGEMIDTKKREHKSGKKIYQVALNGPPFEDSEAYMERYWRAHGAIYGLNESIEEEDYEGYQYELRQLDRELIQEFKVKIPAFPKELVPANQSLEEEEKENAAIQLNAERAKKLNQEYYFIKKKKVSYSPSLIQTASNFTTFKQLPEATAPAYKEYKRVIGKPDFPDCFQGKRTIIGPKIYNILSTFSIYGVQLLASSITVSETVFSEFWTVNCFNLIKCIDANKCTGILRSDTVLKNKEFPYSSYPAIFLDAEILLKIPLKERLLFRLEEANKVEIYHKSLVGKITAVNPLGIDFIPIVQWPG